jgi:hypothetical protein
MFKNRVLYKNKNIKITKYKLALFFVIVLILVSPIISVEFILGYASFIDGDLNIKSIMLALFVLLFYFLSIILPIMLALIQSIHLFGKNTDRIKKIKQFGCYFLATIIIFANFYYLSSATNDYHDAINKYLKYSYLKINPSTERKELVLKNNSLLEDSRAFEGIDDRLFYGVDYPRNNWWDSEEFSIESIFDNLGENVAPFGDDSAVVMPKADNRVSVYSSCFLFSVSILTNSENLDIIPKTWDTKLMVAFEKLLSFAYLILFIGMLLNDWWRKKC